MWRINPFDVVNMGRTGDGRVFTDLLDSLIRAHAHSALIPQADIHTNLRVNLADGGVDTQIDSASAADAFGWTETPTVWQYKATAHTDITEKTLEDEVRKPYAAQLIAAGYAYRMCVCDEAPAEWKSAREKKLNEVIQTIRPDAPVGRILIAGDIAAWASTFPAIVLAHFRSDPRGPVAALESWGANAVGVTGRYVQVPSWDPTSQRIADHTDLSVAVPSVVQVIQGEAGVGKTRMTYETLAAIPGARELIVYTSDEQTAINLAASIAADRTLRAIIVADECSVESRLKIGDWLAGHPDRARVIVIDNSGRTISSADPEAVLPKIERNLLRQILLENFPNVPEERRRAYSDLSEGFVRLAADMCQHDAEIAAAGHVGPVAQRLRDYLVSRLSDEHLSYVQAIALLERVGFSGNVSGEIDRLCGFLDLDAKKLRQAISLLHNAPGFVALAGRYLYVTPELIAQVAFEGAWQRWASIDPDGFLERLPAEFQNSFIGRVVSSGGEGVRSLVAGSFRQRFASVEPARLAGLETVDQIVAVTEADPATYLPLLRGLLERSSLDELRLVTGRSSSNGRWGPRRYLVWLLERLASFAEYFADAEASLLRLALAESEPSIGNNATAQWRQLFRIHLSGTAVPFPDRLARLRQLLPSEPETVEMALRALEEALSSHPTRMVGPSVVAGRIVPAEWRPQTRSEHLRCVSDAMEVIVEFMDQAPLPVSRSALQLLIAKVRLLLGQGNLERLSAIFAARPVDDADRVKLVGAVEAYLRFEGPKAEEVYKARVEDWLTALMPNDVHGRLVTAVGVSPWHYAVSEQEESWKNDLRSLAGELLASSAVFESELPWLLSPEAESAGHLGLELGRLDAKEDLMEPILLGSMGSGTSALARGYVSGRLSDESAERRINERLDLLEQVNPAFAYDIFSVDTEKTRAIERTMSLVDSGALPARYLLGVGRFANLDSDRLAAILQRLLAVGAEEYAAAVSGALQLLSFQCLATGGRGAPTPIEGVAAEAWEVLEAVVVTPGVRDTYWWNDLLVALASNDPPRAARLAVASLNSEDINVRHEGATAVANIAGTHPDEFLRELGLLLSDKKNSWRFYIGNHEEVFQQIPEGTLTAWVESVSEEVAAAIARHLPKPYVDSEGVPIVPRSTLALFDTYGGSDAVFHEFVAGTHNMQMYTGDIAGRHEQEAEVARKFLNHPVARIREWASIEERQSLGEAKRMRQEEEEDRFR